MKAKTTMKLIAACALLVFFFSLSTAHAQEAKKIKIGYPAIASNQIHIWVAKDAGLFKHYGLDPELVFFRGGQLATQALVAGDPPIVNIGTVVQAGLQGHDLVLIASSENSYAYSVVGKPTTLSKLEQLKGKKLGVSGFGSASHNAALILLRRLNLEPNKDVSIVVAGGTADEDADGVVTSTDKGPGTPTVATVDATGCPHDADGYRVLDGLNKCPDTPAGVTVDANGCPRAPPA